MTAVHTAVEVSELPPANSNPGMIDGYSYLGCFLSSSEFSTFEQVDECDSMTLERCVGLCDGKTYAGVVGRQCHCAAALDPDTRAAVVSPAPSSSSAGGRSRRGAEIALDLCGGDGSLLTVYADVRAEEHPQPPPMAAPMNAVVETVTMCAKETGAVQTSRPLTIPGGNSTVRPPPVIPASGAEDRQGPSGMSLAVGVVLVGAIMVM